VRLLYYGKQIRNKPILTKYLKKLALEVEIIDEMKAGFSFR